MGCGQPPRPETEVIVRIPPSRTFLDQPPDGSNYASFDSSIVLERRRQYCVARHCSWMVRRNARPAAHLQYATLVREGPVVSNVVFETYRSTGRSVRDTSRASERVAAPAATRRASHCSNDSHSGEHETHDDGCWALALRTNLRAEHRFRACRRGRQRRRARPISHE